jgi:hypothetical protein
VEPADHIPSSFDALIQILVKEHKSNAEEITLLSSVVSSIGSPEGEWLFKHMITVG